MILEASSHATRKHDGKNAQRVRVYLGIKQASLAADLGISQEAVSKIEQQEEIDDSLLNKIANALGVSADVIRHFEIERAIYNINNIRDNSFAEGSTSIAQQFNPLDKLVELYERLLKSEREKIDFLLKDRK